MTVVSAAKYTQPREDPNSPGQYLEPPVYGKGCCNLALELRFKYTGTPAEVPAPSIAAIDEKGGRFNAMGQIANIVATSSDVEAMSWLVSLARSEPGKRALKGGETFGASQPITFYIGDIPNASSGLKIVFADIPPIPVEPKSLK